VGQRAQQGPGVRVGAAQHPEDAVTLVELEGRARLLALLALRWFSFVVCEE
jgi:hypothetical protein